MLRLRQQQQLLLLRLLRLPPLPPPPLLQMLLLLRLLLRLLLLRLPLPRERRTAVLRLCSEHAHDLQLSTLELLAGGGGMRVTALDGGTVDLEWTEAAKAELWRAAVAFVAASMVFIRRTVPADAPPAPSEAAPQRQRL